MVKLHIGCGASLLDGYVNIDKIEKAGVLYRDVLRGIPFSDESVDEIRTENFLEHVPQVDVIWLMNEMWRVLKVGGFAHHLIPEAGTVMFYQDPTHLSHWVPETFTYFMLNHRRNLYYRGAIKPWSVEHLRYTDPNKLIDVKMVKPPVVR
jgi:predicted SAM-dependent methyltransferase